MKLKNNHNMDYSEIQQKYDNEQYARFFSQCKEKKKSSDPETRATGKALEKSYRIFKEYGVPFAVAQSIYPQLCRVYGNYCFEHAKIIEDKKNGQS